MEHRISPSESAELGVKTTAGVAIERSAGAIALGLACLLALGGMILAAFATVSGPGVGGDATIYLISGENFYAGQGLGWVEADGSFRLLPYAPPLYPLVVGAAGRLVGDIQAAARWLNLLLLGATALLLGWTAFRATGSPWLASLVSGLAALSPVILNVHLWAMSEPLFLFLSVASLFLLWSYLGQPHRSTLAGAALLAGLAFLTRYIGLALVLAGGLALLMRRDHPGDPAGLRFLLRRTGWRDGLLFGAIAAAPMAAWLAIGLLFTGTLASRSGQPVEAYWLRFLEICPALEKIYLFWLLPDSVSTRLPGLAQQAAWAAPLLGLLALAWAGWRRRNKQAAESDSVVLDQSASRLVAVYGLFIGLYLVVLAGVQVFTYPPVTLASRMLSPVHLGALVLAPVFLWQARLRLLPASRLALAVLALAAAFFLGSYSLRSALIAREYQSTGIGYNAAEWRDSATAARLADLPADVPIISNEVTAVMFFTGRPAYALQEIYQQQPSVVFTAYGEGADPAQLAFRSQGGALALFYQTLNDDFAIYGERVDERLAALTRGLYPYFESEDGAIYFWTRPEISDGACNTCREDRYR